MLWSAIPLLAFALGATSEGVPMDEVVRGNNAFAVELFGELREQPGNLFFSPSSVSTALAMTYAGAGGETAAQMARTLHFGPDPARLHRAFAALIGSTGSAGSKPGDRLSVANRLWGQKGFAYRPEFLATTRDQYGAELAEVDFAASEQARRSINAWVSEETRGKIPDLIASGVLDSLTRLVLTNAIYFKGSWTVPFAKGATQDAPFHLGGGRDVAVPLMSRRGDLRCWAGDGLKALELPYAGGDLSMVVLLPDALDGLPALEGNLTGGRLAGWVAGLKERKVNVFLPRFRMASEFSMAGTLGAMGMPLAFDRRRADFSGISAKEPLSIGAVIHKAFVDVNEEGTEAAAATGVAMKTRAMRPDAPPEVFRADHPFLFLIRDARTGSILFLGRVADPRG